MSKEHTKTPWKQHNIYVDAADNSRTIAMCGVGTTTGNEIANAAHIVRCVNSHESLVEALKSVLDDLKVMYDMDGRPIEPHEREVMEQARAALAAAKGEA